MGGKRTGRIYDGFIVIELTLLLLREVFTNMWSRFRGYNVVEKSKVPIRNLTYRPDFAALLHLSAILVAVVVVSLNIRGHFIGKELQGSINTTGTKMLALQFAAKIHELLMLASLSDLLYTALLDLLVLGEGAPFSALSTGDHFSSISYLWSREYLALLASAFTRKWLFVALVTVCTLLGVLVGPSSATAMAPGLNDWLATRIKIPLTDLTESVWPEVMNLTTGPSFQCDGTYQSCSTLGAIDSLSVNLFSFWDKETLGPYLAMPEKISIPSNQSVRTMDARLRGPFTLYQPDFVSVTVQQELVANLLNSFRLLWYRSNSNSCAADKGGFCSYADIKWQIKAQQPVVRTACNWIEDGKTASFPTMTKINGSLVSEIPPVRLPAMDNSSNYQLKLVDIGQSGFSNVSVGAWIQAPFGGKDEIVRFACSIDAQWANATSVSTFLGGPYLVSGSPEFFFAPDAVGSEYRGVRTKIEPGWESEMNPSFVARSNKSAFELLFTSGPVPAPSNAAPKIESVLAILVAESMSRVGSEVSLDLEGLKHTSVRLQWDDLKTLTGAGNGGHLMFETRVTGYAYGLRTADNFSVGTFLSVLTLILYCAGVIIVVGLRRSRQQYKVTTWRSSLDLLSLALHTSSDQSIACTSAGIGEIGTLTKTALMMRKDEHVELVLDQSLASKSGLEHLRVDEVVDSR